METNIVSNLALLFITAGITTIIFKSFKQPLILGYIVAGFLVGPHFGLFPSMTSPETVEQWSEIGVIFMLFGLGLEFSFRKVIKMGATALIVAATMLGGMTLVALIVGSFLGWNNMECIFIGAGVMSMSATTIIIKAFDDMGLNKKRFTQVVFGTLVYEDIIAVLLMVLLSTMAASQQFAGGEMAFALLKLLFFIILWFVVGIYLIPLILKQGREWINDEMLTILSIGLCFGMVVLAEKVGFSSALGAFVMGSLLAETIEGEHITQLIKGIKDLFGAVFFVSVGMMVNPNAIVEHWALILLLSALVVLIKPMFSLTGTLLAGKGLDTAVKVSLSLVPVSEFSFIIIAQGIGANVLPDYFYPVVVTVSVVTTFITPYYVRWSDSVSGFLHKKLPPKLVKILSPVHQETHLVAEKNEWKELLKSYFIRYFICIILLVAVFIGTKTLLWNFLDKHFETLSDTWIKAICVSVAIVTMLPIQIGLATLSSESKKHYASLWNAGRINRGPLISLVLWGICTAIVSMFFTLSHFFAVKGLLLPVLFALIFVFFFFRRRIKAFARVESIFIANLNEKEEYERSIKEQEEKEPVTENFDIGADSQYAGKMLKELTIRKDYGVSIVKIERGDEIIIPSADDSILAGDRIQIIGTPSQIDQFRKSL
ncbi:MAG: cation:proton antiporter [Bacteroidales bacterium]|nr:cation:proton antiporter [Bacteroidales bacterium]